MTNPVIGPLAVFLTAAAMTAPALAQRAAPVTVGPERIVCNASFCEMGSGARPQERVRVIVSNLPANEIQRLRKCTGVSTPCIVTVGGTEQGDRMKVLASSIHWQESMGQESMGQESLRQESIGQESMGHDPMGQDLVGRD